MPLIDLVFKLFLKELKSCPILLYDLRPGTDTDCNVVLLTLPEYDVAGTAP